MTTGYTMMLEDENVDFNAFIMSCAKAFGACVTMRDEPHDKEIPEKFEPSDHHSKALAKTNFELVAFLDLPEEDRVTIWNDEHDRARKMREETLEGKVKLHRNYSNMLEKVLAWTPPTGDHKGLKDFMIEQIQTSIDHDCDIKYYDKNPVVQMNFTEWVEMKKECLEDSIKYHIEHGKKEIDSFNKKNEWIKDLRNSLK